MAFKRGLGRAGKVWTHPSVVEANAHFTACMARLKSCPFKATARLDKSCGFLISLTRLAPRIRGVQLLLVGVLPGMESPAYRPNGSGVGVHRFPSAQGRGIATPATKTCRWGPRIRGDLGAGCTRHAAYASAGADAPTTAGLETGAAFDKTGAAFDKTGVAGKVRRIETVN